MIVTNPALRVALRKREITLAVLLVTLIASIVSYWYIPKGFFPQQDTGLIVGSTSGARYFGAGYGEQAIGAGARHHE